MKMPPTQIEYIRFTGGLDLITPPLSMPPGHCREAQNYEIDTLGGYVRTGGYERFDGRFSPSLALATVVGVSFSGAVPLESTIVGATSGATGIVVGVNDHQIIFTGGTGLFQVGETINIGGLPVATVTTDPAVDGGDTPDLRAQYKAMAANYYRQFIGAVPGSGPIRGLKYFEGTLYAVRDNVGATAAEFYKSSVAGWVHVPLGEEIEFTNADTSVLENGTLTQGGVTATIKRVLVRTGTLASGVNTGSLVLSGRSGGNYAAGAATTSTGGNLTLSGAQSQITLLPGGRYRFVKFDFGSGFRIYGADGVNRGFEFDGETYCPITTGMVQDTPLLVAAHRNHLFFSFRNSLQFSGIGAPYTWSPLLGAGEINLGDDISNLLPMPGDNIANGAMACFTRQRSFMLYGTSAADFQLVTQRYDTGAIPYTTQFINTAYLMDNRGITNLAATDAFGNFASSALSQLIRPYIIQNKTRVLDSCVIQDKNQYRVLFSGGRLITMTLIGNEVAGFMPLVYDKNMVLMEADDDLEGNEVIFYGDEDGFVYQAERGTSFDGNRIQSFMDLSFNHSKSPRGLKQYRKGVFEAGGSGFAEFRFSAAIGYGKSEIEQIQESRVGFGSDTLGGGSWDTGTWDVGTWDGQRLLPAEIVLTGVAENMSMRLSQDSDYYEAMTFYGALLHYTQRRQLR